MSVELSSEELIALNRLTIVARVLAGTAHDVNNALLIISGSAELLGSVGSASDAGRRAAERIQSQAARAAAAVNDVMHFARDRGQPAARVSVREVAAKSIAMRAFMLRRSGLVLDFDAAAAPAALVDGSSTRLQQAVLNLIINAEQALLGSQGGKISLDLREAADDVVLQVIDNGPGVDRTVSDRLFDAFVTTRPVADATGLGLTVARIIARDHGGDVTLESSTQGARATLRVPRARA